MGWEIPLYRDRYYASIDVLMGWDNPTNTSARRRGARRAAAAGVAAHRARVRAAERPRRHTGAAARDAGGDSKT